MSDTLMQHNHHVICWRYHMIANEVRDEWECEYTAEMIEALAHRPRPVLN